MFRSETKLTALMNKFYDTISELAVCEAISSGKDGKKVYCTQTKKTHEPNNHYNPNAAFHEGNRFMKFFRSLLFEGSTTWPGSVVKFLNVNLIICLKIIGSFKFSHHLSENEKQSKFKYIYELLKVRINFINSIEYNVSLMRV